MVTYSFKDFNIISLLDFLNQMQKLQFKQSVPSIQPSLIETLSQFPRIHPLIY